MNGGSISGNTAHNGSDIGTGGGISMASSNATLVLSGGAVYGSGAGADANTAGSGASLYVASGTARYGSGESIALEEGGGKGTSETLVGR
jgi:hypothetical protein